MNNEHNPVAVRISRMQRTWIRATRAKKKFNIVRWLIHKEDLPLIEGFYKLESSSHGKVDELIVAMLTDFDDEETYAYQLSKHWVEEYQKALKQYPDLPWKEAGYYQKKLEKQLSQTESEKIWIEILESYQTVIPNEKKRTFLLGLLPRMVYDYDIFNDWLIDFVSLLPAGIGITLIDFHHKQRFAPLLKKFENTSLSIEAEDMDMKGAYAELLQQGNPNEPEVQIRKMIVEMGKATEKNDKKEVHRLGTAMLEIGKNSANTNLWIYTHLIYSGFLFRFKDEQIIPLLDKGIAIAEQAIKNNDLSAVSMLFPLYDYKSAYYSFSGEHTRAFEGFTKEARTAIHYNNNYTAISACKNAILVANKHGFKEEMNDFLNEGMFEKLYLISDEELQASEFFYIVNFYLSRENNISEKKENEMRERMDRLFGNNWEERSIQKGGFFINPEKTLKNAFIQ